MKNNEYDKKIQSLLKELCLPTIKEIYEESVLSAIKEGVDYKFFLLELLEAESLQRTHNKIERNVRESKLPPGKTLQTFEMQRVPLKVKSIVTHLTDGSFLKRTENVLIFGKPGSGKTHLLCAIAYELIQLQKKVWFTKCNALVEMLLQAKKELLLENFLKKSGKYDAVIIDDIGYVKYSREEMEVLFSFLAYRYERGSVMLTSNLPFSKWEDIFHDPMTTAAAIDRLVHHSIIIELNIDSYRLEQAKKNKEELKNSVENN